MPKYLLGTDNGCTMSKAALFDLDGNEVAVASCKTTLLTPESGHAERDPEELWQSTASVIRQVLADSQINPGDLAAVASAGHGNGLYLIDEAGQPVRNAILSTDARAADVITQWEAQGLDKALRPKTMQSVWPAQPNALLCWLKAHEPETIARARWVLMAKDYVRFRLTGEVHAELTDMSGTSLLNVATADYDLELLAAWGLADLRDLLPPLVHSAEVCGHVTAEAAAATGLREGTPVAGGLFDIDACALSSGVLDESQLCMVAGTWGNNQYVSATPVASDAVFMTSCFCVPGHYLMLEGSPTSASNLEWFVTEFLGAEKERCEARGQSVYDLCNELVAASRPDPNGPLFLPFLSGSHASLAARAEFFGLTAWHSRGDVLRAIYEGVVFAHKWHLNKLLQFRDLPEAVRLTGGAARSEVWVQMFADCLQAPVEIPAGQELGALGAAICASVAAGSHPDYESAVGAMVRFARRQEPDPTLAGYYSRRHQRYCQLIEALEPLWNE